MDLSRYFDNAASTPCDPRVLEEMIPYFHLQPGNARSLHSFGRFAEAAVDRARQSLAQLIGADDPSQIIFTSGATEANHLLLHSFGHNLLTSCVEHSSVREVALQENLETFKQSGSEIQTHKIRSDQVASLIAVSNEVGTILPTDTNHVLAPGRLHLDATQAIGKICLQQWGAHFLSGSGHKFYGPKGIGFLFAQDPTELAPRFTGGGQENGLRSGTLNVPGIVGIGAAAKIAVDEMEENFSFATELKQIVLDALGDVTDLRVNGGANVSPYILSVSVQGVEAETLLLEMDAAGFAVSAGAACSSRNTGNNPVLEAMGLEPDWLRGTLRLSFGKFNTREAAQALGASLRQVIENVRTLRR